jgi:hypothetical protein
VIGGGVVDVLVSSSASRPQPASARAAAVAATANRLRHAGRRAGRICSLVVFTAIAALEMIAA